MNVKNPLQKIVKVEPNPELKRFLQYYEQQGLSVIPLVHGNKKPAIDSWEPYQKKKASHAQIEKWFYTGAPFNIGIVCGSASSKPLRYVDDQIFFLVVLDFEDKKIAYKIFGKNIAKETFVVESGSGKGLHIYFWVPYPTRKFKIKELALDVQGQGSYVVAPPSIHPSGGKYIAEKFQDQPITMWKGADFEEDLYAKIKRTFKNFKPEEHRQQIDAEKLLGGVNQGERNQTCMYLATWFRRLGKTREETISTLSNWNSQLAEPLEERELTRTIESAFRPEEPYHFWYTKNPETSKKTEVFTKEEIAKAQEILKQEDIYPIVLDALKEIQGEEKTKISLFLLNLVKESVDLSGDSSSGKNTICDAVLECYPRDSYLKITATSSRVLRYLEKAPTIYFAERAAYKARGDDREETITEYDVKVAISEGKLTTYMTVKGEHGWTYQKIETEIDNFISTTTEVKVSDELINREWELTTDAGKELTSKVIGTALDQTETLPSKRVNTDRQKKILRALTKEIRQEMPKLYVIPYATLLKPLIPNETRGRRDVEKLVKAIYASACLHYKNRPIIEGAIVCMPQDAFYVWQYMDEAITGTFTSMTRRARQVWENAEEILKNDQQLDAETLAAQTGLKNRGAWEWLKKFEDLKLIWRHKIQGKKDVYFTGLPTEETCFTVTYEELIEKTKEWAKVHNLQICSSEPRLKKFFGQKLISKSRFKPANVQIQKNDGKSMGNESASQKMQIADWPSYPDK